MEGKNTEELPEKELSHVKAEGAKYLAKLDKILKTKDATEEQILKELYQAFVEKAKGRLQKARNQQDCIKRQNMLVSDRISAQNQLEKHKKDTAILQGLNNTLEKQNSELHEEYKKIIARHQEQRKEINEKMQEEIKMVQKEMESEVQRKQELAQENEALTEKIKELKEITTATNASVEKALGKSDLDVDKLEEQLKQRIEAETDKIVNDEKEKVKTQNEELQKTISDKAQILEGYAKQFEEYKEKIGKINNEVNEYKNTLEERAKKIIETHDENKVIEEKITKTKTMIADLKKQIDKSFKEKEILNNLKQTLNTQIAAKALPKKE